MVLSISGRSVGSYWRSVGRDGRLWDLGYWGGGGVGYIGDIWETSLEISGGFLGI